VYSCMLLQNAEAEVDAREKQTQLEAKLNSLQEQVIRQAEQLQQEADKIHVANQEKQSLEAALEIGAKTVAEKELEIEGLRELVREADERFSRYITPSEKREEEEAESRVRQLAEQVKRQEDALLQASTRADNAEKEKQSLEAALEISEKTSEERECEIEELHDRVRQLDERLASETARLQKVVDEEKATAENLRVQWQQLQSMTQVHHVFVNRNQLAVFNNLISNYVDIRTCFNVIFRLN
jgi:chromosome segregation ATPase